MSIDYSQIEAPSYAFGNSADIHQAILAGLHRDATDAVNSNFIHANNILGQTISTPLLFNVTGDDDDETHLRLAKKGWVKNRIAKLVLDTEFHKIGEIVNPTNKSNICRVCCALTKSIFSLFG